MRKGFQHMLADRHLRHVRRLLSGASIAALAGSMLLGAVVWLTLPEAGTLYQGFWTELRNGLSGGRYRVAMHCRLKDNTVGMTVRAFDRAAAQAALEWTLPVCELTTLARVQVSGWTASWYRGDFVCPSNFHKRTVRLSAPSIEAALAAARAGARDCEVEYADQTDCPWFRANCERQSVDFRAEAQMSSPRNFR
jgi:hypothetical protein